MRRIVTIGLALMALGGVGLTPVAGQEASPAATGACTVEPYDLTEVLANAAAGSDAASPDADMAIERPTGEPADDETVAGVTETVDQFFACLNEGYLYRYIFVFTPEYLTQFLVETGGVDAETNEQLAEEIANEPEPVPVPVPEEEQTVLVGIENVETLDDGRVVATVVGDDLSSDSPESPVYFIFAEVDGVFLIDGVIDPVTEDATPEA